MQKQFEAVTAQLQSFMNPATGFAELIAKNV